MLLFIESPPGALMAKRALTLSSVYQISIIDENLQVEVCLIR